MLYSFFGTIPSDLNHLNCWTEDGAQTLVCQLLCAW